ncbi:DUF262 domain-containing HNH endonuclease family protein [Spiroplasma endosymbiont of Othius punctulatus]|uniref:DUF262 domain-containing protein n=1 Tax=Spiroplasma endosymbiont of Othius punctulatus TaxID=3066289 RepID=UPI0030CACADD
MNKLKMWNIGTNFNSYLKDYQAINFFKKGDKLFFMLGNENTEFKVKVNGDKIFKIKDGKDSTFKQVLRVWITLGFIKLNSNSFIEKIADIMKFEFTVCVDPGSDLVVETKQTIIDRLGGKKEFSFKDEWEFYNGLAFVAVLQNEIKTKKTDNEKFDVIKTATDLFVDSPKFYFDSMDDMKSNTSLKSILSTYKVKQVYDDKKIIKLSYKYLFKNDWSRYYLEDEVEKMFTDGDFSFSSEKNKIVVEDEYKFENDSIKSSSYLFGAFISEFFLKPGISTKITVPIYQRQYNWNKKLALGLLNDLIKLQKGENHYIGSIVLHAPKNKNIYKLIDGQQRLTTCFLILRNIYNVYLYKGYEVPNVLHGIFKIINGENSITKSFIRIDSNPDLRAFNCAMRGATISDTKSNVFDNSVEIFRELKPLNDKSLNDVYLKVVNYLNIVVTSDNVSNEYKLFENLNTKSLPLSVMDLVKNFLFMQIDINLVDKKETILQSMYDEFISSKFRKLKNPDNTMNSFINVFLRFNGEDYSSSSMFENFKKIISSKFTDEKNLSTIDECESLFKHIGEYINLFLSISDSAVYNDPESKTYRYKDLLSMFENREIYYPLIMQTLLLFNYKNFKNDKTIVNNIRKTLFEIEKYEVRLQVSNYKGQSLSSFVDNVTQKLNQDNISDVYMRELLVNGQEDQSNNRVSIDRFKNSLENSDISVKIATLIGYRIENWLSNNMDLFGEEYNYIDTKYLNKSLEHIVPQRPNDKWFEDIIEWSDFSINLQEAKQWKTKYLNKIGNLMCIEKNSNSKGKNHRFKEKINIYKKEQKIADSFQFVGYSGNDLDLIDLTTVERFDKEIIERRTKQIANICAEIWKD